MAKAKSKQQTSLLSFFSPPSGASSAEKSAIKGKSSGGGSSANGSKAGGASKKAARVSEDAGDVAKRIAFSPKAGHKRLSNGAAKKSDANSADGEEDPASPSGATRKAYEDFLGTSSEDEDAGGKRENKAKQTAKEDAPEPKRQRVAVGASKKIIIQDDSDSDEDMPKAGAPPASAGPRSRRARQSAPVKRAKNIVSSEEDDSAAEDDKDSEFSASEASEEDDDDDDEGEEEEEDESMDEEEEEEVAPRKRSSTFKAAKSKASASFLSPPPRAKNASASKASGKVSTPSASPPSSASKKSIETSSAATEACLSGVPAGVFGAGNHIHDSLAFLNEKRKDLNGNKPGDPEYDPRTLYVPPEFIKKETPAMVQWWEVKSRNMDTVLFFKVGKFYELFHMDADVGFKELGLIYMKGEKAHSGFPEIAYSKMSSQLVAKGYRVARVEQTETPDMLKERNSSLAKKAKVVRREVCSLLSIGTNTVSFLDARISSREQATARYLLALKESQDNNSYGHHPANGAVMTIRFGVCLINCATGAIQIGEFSDTEQRDRLKTLFAQFAVVEVINERGGLSEGTRSMLKFAAPDAVRSELRTGSEFWDAQRTVDELDGAGYFAESGWPESVLEFLEMDKTVKANGMLAVSALGGCVWHLRRCIIDQELVSLGNFKRYTPADEEAHAQSKAAVTEEDGELRQEYVVLDAQTIQNLEILVNSYNGARSGSLIDILDKTVTSFGKRLFQEWVLKPLCKISAINERLDAVQELGAHGELLLELRDRLKTLPDLERLLSRIHALGSTHRAREHPDSRAIMYESETYNIRKIRDFVTVLNGFGSAVALVNELGPQLARMDSPLLQTILKIHTAADRASLKSGHFPALTSKLEFFRHSFDQAAAQKSGVIIPQEGVDPEYDGAIAEIAEVEAEFESYLNEQRKALQCRQLAFFGTKKKEDRYQIEVPESAIRKQPKEYELKSRRKGYKRFHTPTIRGLLKRLAAAEDRKEQAFKDQTRRMFHKFDEDYKSWMKAVQCLAVLDCLLSLALVSSQSDGYVRPELVASERPFIDIADGVHPCVAATFDGDFIPNDTQIDGKTSMLLLSGPNMGGKSTLLRQTCVLALMAQLGCFVPASKCRLSPVDRVFTRIGASDRILAGQSTLFVELAETATILRHATRHSLVILDELGRGTSTFDGTAIAYSVVEHLVRDVRCRALFATHYHSLVEEYEAHESVALAHMGCLVDPENERRVTFLYKLAPGMCPKSYGINVAMLARLPQEVVDCAARKSEQFERALQQQHQQHQSDGKDVSLETVKRFVSADAVDAAALMDAWRSAKRAIDAHES